MSPIHQSCLQFFSKINGIGQERVRLKLNFSTVHAQKQKAPQPRLRINKAQTSGSLTAVLFKRREEDEKQQDVR